MLHVSLVCVGVCVDAAKQEVALSSTMSSARFLSSTSIFCFVQYICRHLEQAATWCLVREVCPEEVQAVEDCAGYKGRYGAPPNAPARCRRAMASLDACMEAHQAE